MRNRMRIRWLLMLMLVFGAGMLLTSCASVKPFKVSTELSITTQFDGQREMRMIIPAKTFKKAFGNDESALETALKTNRPVSMNTYVSRTEEGDVEIRLVIPFASYDEYYKKVMTIFSGSDAYDKEAMPTVYYEYSDSMLKHGFAVQESFTSKDLCYWLIGMFKESYPKLADMTADQLFEDGETCLIFAGERIETEAAIDYTRMDSNALRSLSVTTTVLESGGFEAQVDYIADRALLDKLGAGLPAMIRALLPDDGTMSTRTTPESVIYSIRLSAFTAEDYEQKMNTALHADNSSITVTNQNGQEGEDSFKAGKEVRLFLDGSYFLDFTDENSQMTYIIRTSPRYSFEKCESEYKYIQSSASENTEEACVTRVVVRPSDNITLSLSYIVDVEQIQVATLMKGPLEYERTIRFTLTNEQNRMIGDQFEDRIRDRLFEDMTLKKTQGVSQVTYDIHMSAVTAADLSRATSAFLDGDDAFSNSVLTGGTGLSDVSRLNRLRYDYADTINFMLFLGPSQSLKGIYYAFSYPDGYTAHFTDNNNYEDTRESGQVVSCVTYNKVIEVHSYAEKVNVGGILMRILPLAALLLILLVVIPNLGGIIKCIRTRSVDPKVLNLYSHKGYVSVTIVTVCAVVMVFFVIRLVFGIY